MDGQRHPHPGPPHLQGGDEDPPLAPPLHRQQAVPGRLDLQRLRHPEPGQPHRHRRRVRRLHARLPAPGPAGVPGGHVRWPVHVLALLRPGRHPGHEPPHPEPGTALRIFTVGLGLSRPARHLRPHFRAADHRGQRDRPDRPRLPVLGSFGLRPLPQRHPDEQPGRPAPLHHQHGQGAVRAALRLRLAALREQDRGARRLRDLLRAGEHGRPREQQHGAVPPRRDRDQRPHPEADDGRFLPGQGSHDLGRAFAGSDGHGHEDGPQPPLQHRRAAASSPRAPCSR